MNIEKVKIGQVKPNETNPRVIRDDKFRKLVESIKGFPEMLKIRPIVVDENMIVLGGNMRLRACKEAGLKDVFIIRANDLTESQKAEFVIKDNASSGEWDWDMLANEWNVTDLDNWALDVWKISLDDEVTEGEDIITNNEKFLHVDDIAVDYLNGDMKKFEIFVDQQDYDEVLRKLNALKKREELETNSDAIVWLILNS
jgi:hypothetical protein